MPTDDNGRMRPAMAEADQKRLQRAGKIKQGAALGVAFRSASGKTILSHVGRGLVEKLVYLMTEANTDVKVLVTVHQIQGVIETFGLAGDVVKEAARVAAQQTSEQALGFRLTDEYAEVLAEEVRLHSGVAEQEEEER